jgi:ATP-binding cassette, subfamily B, bacterial PglK
MSLKSVVTEPTAAVSQAVKLLNVRERWALVGVALMRIFLTALDLGGIVLVGVVVSIVSGTQIGATSAVGTTLAFLASLGFANGYAVLAAAAIGFFLIKGLVSIWLNLVTARYLASLETQRSTRLFKGLLDSDMSAFDGLARNEILYGLTHSTSVIFSQTLTIATSLVGEIALLVAVSIYLAVTNFSLFAVIATFFGLVGAGMQYFLGTKATKAGYEAQTSLMKAQATAMGSLENYRQLRVFGRPDAYLERFAKYRRSLAMQNAVNSMLVGLPRYITEIAVMLGVGFLILLRSNDSVLSVGAPTVAVFLVGMFRIVASMLPIQSGLTALAKNRSETRLAYELIERISANEKSVDANPVSAGESFVTVQNISFRYPLNNDCVFENLSFSVAKGEFVAITGRSGTGKSTLADLLLGVRKPHEGQISIDGMPVRKYLETFPGGIGYVPQRVNLLDASLRENLLLGRTSTDEFSDAHLTRMLEALDLGGFLGSLPKGLGTRIGENGVELSGGQTQRIGLVRAILGNPRLLILDESTSALDVETSTIVTELIERLHGNTTLIVIAHHPETIRSADKVFRLSRGKLTIA